MRILLLAPNLQKTGGIEQYTKNLQGALGELGVDVKTIEYRGGIVGKMWFALTSFFEVLFYGPDYIFCAHVNFSPLCLWIQKLLKTHFVVFTHGIDVWGLQDEKKKRALQGAKKVVTVSRFTKEKLVEQVPVTKESIYLLPNAINAKQFYPQEKPKNLLEQYDLKGKKTIFTLTRLSASEQYKGYDQVIRAMPQVLKEAPNAVYVIGGTGSDKERAENLAKELSVEGRVIFAGFIPEEEKRDYYNLCDVFVMPSKKEGFGIVFLEALACGKPVVAGNKDGSRDPLLDGELGKLVDPDSVEQVANAIICLLKRRQAPEEKGQLHDQTIKHFGLAIFKEKTAQLLQEL